MSRCVVIPFDGEFTDLTAEQLLQLNRTKTGFASNLPKLLSLGNDDTEEICHTIDEMKKEVSVSLEKYGLSQPSPRISTNISQLFAFTIKV